MLKYLNVSRHRILFLQMWQRAAHEITDMAAVMQWSLPLVGLSPWILGAGKHLQKEPKIN